MVDNGNVFTLYSDEAKQNAIYPRTTFNAVSGANGQTWQQELDAKTNVSDIKDNLTSTDTNKPLSANQGNVIRKKLVSNLFKPTLATTTQSGITVTNNNDGTYTINGTSQNVVTMSLGKMYIKANSKLVGCPAGGGDTKYTIYLDINGTPQGSDGGSGLTINTSAEYDVRIGVASGQTLNNLLFKPMICADTSATYNDFVSYDDSIAYNKNINNYSTSEQIVGKWIDGRNIYRKSYFVQNVTGTITLDTISNTLDVITLSGCGKISQDIWFPISTEDSQGSGSTNYAVINLRGNSLQCNLNTSFTWIRLNAIIEYTKTTD